MEIWYRQGLFRIVHQKFVLSSLYAVLVSKARRPADFDDQPFVSQNSHMSNGFPKVFIILKTHFTLLGELAFSQLELILTPTSVLSALGNVNRQRATTPVHLVTLHFCIVVRKLHSCLVTVDCSPGFWQSSIPSHSFLDLIALLIPFLVKIDLFFSPGLRSSFCLPPKSHWSAI